MLSIYEICLPRYINKIIAIFKRQEKCREILDYKILRLK